MNNYYSPVKFDVPAPVMPQTTEVKPITKKADLEGDTSFNIGFFMSDDAKIEGDAKQVEFELENKKKRSTRSSKVLTPAELPGSGTPAQIQDNTSLAYADSYKNTNTILESAIAQSDQLLGEIKEDIDTIRSSKTLKGKYTYLTNLTASAASLINTRITAAREINSSITKAHELELKRSKDLKDMAREDKNDDARMMDLYNSFINSPIGMYENAYNAPTVPTMMLGTNGANPTVTGVSMSSGDPNNTTNLTPEQVRMRMENNPNVEEIVRYDASSGRRWFEVIDKTTGSVIPGYPTSDPFLLEDVSVDMRAGIAKNRNLDRVWTLQVSGEASEY